eukprot:537089_1
MTYVFIINNADDSCLWWLWSIFCMFTFGFIITISLFIILDILLFTLIYVLNELFFDSIHLLPSFNNQYLWLLVEFICEENCITRLCYINAMLCNIYDTKYYIHNETNSKMELKSYLLNNYHSMFANATLKNMRIECKNTFDKLLSSDGKRYKGVTLKNCSASIPNAFLILKCIKIVLILPIFSFILLIYYHLNDIIIATLIITMVLMLLLVITFITISKQLYFAHHLQIKVAHHLRIRIESFDQKLKCLIYNFNVFNSEKMVKNAFGEGIANIIFGYGIEPLLFDLNNEKGKGSVYRRNYTNDKNDIWDKNNKNVLNLSQRHYAIMLSYMNRIEIFDNCIIEFECLLKTDSFYDSKKMDILLVNVAERNYCLLIAVRYITGNQLNFECGLTKIDIGFGYKPNLSYHTLMEDDRIIIPIELNSGENEQQWISLCVSCDKISSVINFEVNGKNEKILFVGKNIGFEKHVQISNNFQGHIRNIIVDGF